MKNIFVGLFPGFVEPIHVKLPDEAVDVFVPEVLGEDDLLKIINVSNGKLPAIGQPVDSFGVFVILSEWRNYIDDLKSLLDEVSHQIVCNLPFHKIYTTFLNSSIF